MACDGARTSFEASNSSAGANGLLRDGAAPAVGPEDVLAALEIEPVAAESGPAGAPAQPLSASAARACRALEAAAGSGSVSHAALCGPPRP